MVYDPVKICSKNRQLISNMYMPPLPSHFKMHLYYTEIKNNKCYVGQLKLSFPPNLINSIIHKQHTIH